MSNETFDSIEPEQKELIYMLISSINTAKTNLKTQNAKS